MTSDGAVLRSAVLALEAEGRKVLSVPIGHRYVCSACACGSARCWVALTSTADCSPAHERQPSEILKPFPGRTPYLSLRAAMLVVGSFHSGANYLFARPYTCPSQVFSFGALEAEAGCVVHREFVSRTRAGRRPKSLLEADSRLQ